MTTSKSSISDSSISQLNDLLSQFSKSIKTLSTIYSNQLPFKTCLSSQSHPKSLPLQKRYTSPSIPRTKQSFRADCDINRIMQKYFETGILPDLIKRNPQYGDFSEVHSFQEAQNIVAKAKEQFAALPNALRERFHNDPATFLNFVSDPANKDQMAKLGLLKPAPGPAPATLDDVVKELKTNKNAVPSDAK